MLRFLGTIDTCCWNIDFSPVTENGFDVYSEMGLKNLQVMYLIHLFYFNHEHFLTLSGMVYVEVAPKRSYSYHSQILFFLPLLQWLQWFLYFLIFCSVYSSAACVLAVRTGWSQTIVYGKSGRAHFKLGILPLFFRAGKMIGQLKSATSKVKYFKGLEKFFLNQVLMENFWIL